MPRASVGLAMAIFLLILAAAIPAFGQPARAFGPDSTSTGVFTGAGLSPAGSSGSAPAR